MHNSFGNVEWGSTVSSAKDRIRLPQLLLSFKSMVLVWIGDSPETAFDEMNYKQLTPYLRNHSPLPLTPFGRESPTNHHRTIVEGIPTALRRPPSRFHYIKTGMCSTDHQFSCKTRSKHSSN